MWALHTRNLPRDCPCKKLLLLLPDCTKNKLNTTLGAHYGVVQRAHRHSGHVLFNIIYILLILGIIDRNSLLTRP